LRGANMLASAGGRQHGHVDKVLPARDGYSRKTA
jgi:hypothetical protein